MPSVERSRDIRLLHLLDLAQILALALEGFEGIPWSDVIKVFVGQLSHTDVRGTIDCNNKEVSVLEQIVFIKDRNVMRFRII